jgi:hypothetical protein
MYSATFRANGKLMTRKYKSEINGLIRIRKWLLENDGTVTFFAPYEQPRFFTDSEEIHFIEPKKANFYLSKKWLTLRREVFEKYGSVCSCCGATRQSGAQLEVDHIKSRSKYPELELVFSNLQILCKPCNLGKSNDSEKNWLI